MLLITNNMLPAIFTHKGRSTFTNARYCSIDDENAAERTRRIVRILTLNTNSTPAFVRSVPGGFGGADTLERDTLGAFARNPSLVRNLLRLNNTKSAAHVMAIINSLVRMVIGYLFGLRPTSGFTTRIPGVLSISFFYGSIHLLI